MYMYMCNIHHEKILSLRSSDASGDHTHLHFRWQLPHEGAWLRTLI
jgi:hypothetical protein